MIEECYVYKIVAFGGEVALVYFSRYQAITYGVIAVDKFKEFLAEKHKMPMLFSSKLKYECIECMLLGW